MLVAHYISFVAISDLGVLFLPAAAGHWFNVFRLTSGLSYLVLTCRSPCRASTATSSR